MITHSSSTTNKGSVVEIKRHNGCKSFLNLLEIFDVNKQTVIFINLFAYIVSAILMKFVYVVFTQF